MTRASSPCTRRARHVMNSMTAIIETPAYAAWGMVAGSVSMATSGSGASKATDSWYRRSRMGRV